MFINTAPSGAFSKALHSAHVAISSSSQILTGDGYETDTLGVAPSQ